MKMKILILTIAATFGMTALTMAQNVPNYVPTNGLVGWWAFNGNANDESGNSNNGTVIGATLTSDRFNAPGKAYEFASDVMSKIVVANNTTLNFSTNLTISHWVRFNQPWSYHVENTIYKKNAFTNEGFSLGVNQDDSYYGVGNYNWGLAIGNGTNNATANSYPSQTINYSYLNGWHHVVGVCNGSGVLLYLDGQEISNNVFTGTILNSTTDLIFGGSENPVSGAYQRVIDDIGIWNRALTQQEITELFNANNCGNNTAINPQTNTLNTGSTATFNASTSDSNPSYAWQSDFGQGYVTLNDFGNYSGTNTATLNIANVQLANHNQPIRVITSSGNCIDTSNVSIISIADTCINTITDTTLITVTDTLIINSTITSLSPPNNSNTIKVFPNPTNDHITIDYGNFSIMTGYQLQIENSLGQQVFQTNITQQNDYLNLTTWGGNGLYFVHIIDPQGNTIDIRKIVLQ